MKTKYKYFSFLWLIAILSLLVILSLLSGCTIIKCGPCWYIRGGPSEIKDAYMYADPNGIHIEASEFKAEVPVEILRGL